MALVLLSSAGCGDGEATKNSGNVTGAIVQDAKSTGPATRQTLARFAELAHASGVKFEYRDGQEAGNYAILESLGGGVALFDFDGDGALDIFLPGGGKYGPQ
jgi:hypothetical protein